jgi:chromosome segregation ATPase
MKKYIIIMLIPFLFACGREAKQKAAELQIRNDSLIHQTAQKDIAIKDFLNSVNEVQLLFDSIKLRENIIDVNTEKMGEMKSPLKAKMRSDILAIYNQLLKDKNQLQILSAKLKSSGSKLAEFQTLVDRLQKDIAEKDSEMTSLRDRLSQMDIAVNTANQKIDTLNNMVQVKDQQINTQIQTINDQTVAMNTAYYVLGTNKQLADENIIKRGKVLPDFDRSKFTKVDIRNMSEIPITSKKIKLLSNHPTNSYKLLMDGKKVKAIDITDEKRFWSNTKYLIVSLQ